MVKKLKIKDDEIIEFEVVFRKRKTLAIEIKPPDNIRVLVPMGVTEKEILKVVKSKSKWILKKLSDIKEMGYEKLDKKYVDDELFMYLGKNYFLEVKIDEKIKKSQVEIYENKILVTVKIKSDEKIKEALEIWYREKAAEKILERVKIFQSYISINPRKIKVKTQKKRWGSCTSNRDMLFNWKIIMAPIEVLDYIVLHEMCHLIHMNHSPEFWNLVHQIMPDYKVKKDWLKRNGFKMEI